MAAHARYQVLFVCTANLCRSPMAEYLMRQELIAIWGPAEAERWRILSAGVAARANLAIHPFAASALAERGINAGEFRSRRLTTDLVHESDLVLTATREHRALVVRLVPSVLGRIYTIKQMGNLLSVAPRQQTAHPIDAGLTLIEQAEKSRRLVDARTKQDDLADPIGESMSRFKKCAKSLTRSIEEILKPLPTTPAPGPR